MTIQTMKHFIIQSDQQAGGAAECPGSGIGYHPEAVSGECQRNAGYGQQEKRD